MPYVGYTIPRVPAECLVFCHSIEYTECLAGLRSSSPFVRIGSPCPRPQASAPSFRFRGRKGGGGSGAHCFAAPLQVPSHPLTDLDFWTFSYRHFIYCCKCNPSSVNKYTNVLYLLVIILKVFLLLFCAGEEFLNWIWSTCLISAKKRGEDAPNRTSLIPFGKKEHRKHPSFLYFGHKP
jgi:hypothetical protein